MITTKNVIAFMVVLGCYCLSLNTYLTFPPVWDAAPGVFAPAIFLYENNLDFSALSSLGGYQDAGPNVHTYSSITLLTLLVMKLFNGEVDLYLPALHILNFIMGAMAVTICLSTLKRLYNLRTGLLVALLLLLNPLYSVQVSYVYTEIAGSLCAIAALNSWVFKRYWLSIVFAILACSIKSLGLFIVAGIGFLLVLDMFRLGPRWGIPKLSVLTMTVFAMELIKITFIDRSEHAGASYEQHITNVVWYLNQVPELYIWLVLFLYATIWLIFKYQFYFIDEPKTSLFTAIEDNKERFLIGSAVLVAAFAGFIVTVYKAGFNFYPLLRYYVWVLPIVISLSIIFLNELPFLAKRHQWYGVSSRSSLYPYAAWIMIFLIAGYSALNRYGWLYPRHELAINSFSVVERSFEYVNFFELQRSAVNLVAEKYPDDVVYVTRSEYYFLSSPLMGYVENKPADVRFILASDQASSDLADYPDSFLVLLANSNSYHGQGLLKRLMDLASKDDRYSIKTLEEIHIGPFTASLSKIEKII